MRRTQRLLPQKNAAETTRNGASMDKTNVMRILEREKVAYAAHGYDAAVTDGERVAALLGEDPARVFKTLVTVGADRAHYVFVVPVSATLDLKQAARAVNVKYVEMLKQKELFPLTAHIHGGCSPLGMKKAFRTVIDSSALDAQTVFVSAGQVGRQVEVSPTELARLSNAAFAELAR